MVAIPVLLMVRELGIGGAERDLTKVAIGLDRRRFEPHVACFLGQGIRAVDLRAAAVPILELPVRSFKSPAVFQCALQLRSYIREKGIRLMHTFDTPTDIFGVPAAKFAGIPVISSQLWLSDVIERPSRYLVHLSNRLADRIVVNSDAVRRSLITNEGFRPGKIFLNYNGIDRKVFYPADVRRPKEVADASVVIGTMSALRPEKRIDLLMRAFRRVCDSHAGVKLMIVGGGALRLSLERLRAELSLEESCVMIPTQGDVTMWLQAMDVFALCSDSESFPNALLEAMACGCAVVGSRVGGIPELLSEGCGLLFDAGDEVQLSEHLKKLIDEPALRQSLRSRAVERSREFSMERVWDRLAGLYEGMILKTGG